MITFGLKFAVESDFTRARRLLQPRWRHAGTVSQRGRLLLLTSSLLCITAVAVCQHNPASSGVSGSKQEAAKAEKSATPATENPDKVLKRQTPAGHAIPEEQAPVLLDAPTTSAPGGGPGVDETQVTMELAQLIEQGKFDDVEPRLVEYLKEKPASWRAHYFYGYVLFRQRRLSAAIKELAKSLELNTENAEAHKILGRVLSIVGRYDLALRELDEARRLMPDSAEVYYNRGRIFSIQDDFHRARQEFEAAVRLNPNYMEAYNALGFALEALGDDPGAYESYRKAVQINEQQAGRFDAPYVNLSGYYGRRGDFPKALDYARKALDLNPTSDLAYYQMAKAYRTMEDWPRTAEALEKAIAIKPSSAQYHYVLSFAYRKLGKQKESQAALAEFRKIERQTAELEKQRREARRATTSPIPSQLE